MSTASICSRHEVYVSRLYSAYYRNTCVHFLSTLDYRQPYGNLWILTLCSAQVVFCGNRAVFRTRCQGFESHLTHGRKA